MRIPFIGRFFGKGSEQAVPAQPSAPEAPVGGRAFMPESIGGPLPTIPASADTPKVGVSPTEGLLKYPPEQQAPATPEGQSSQNPSAENKG